MYTFVRVIAIYNKSKLTRNLLKNADVSLITIVINFDNFVFQVTIGTSLVQVLEDTLLYESSNGSSFLLTIIPSVLVPVLVILICSVMCLVLIFKKKYKAKEHHLTAEMRELESSGMHKDG